MTPHQNTKSGFTPVCRTEKKAGDFVYRYVGGKHVPVPVRKESVQ